MRSPHPHRIKTYNNGLKVIKMDKTEQDMINDIRITEKTMEEAVVSYNATVVRYYDFITN